ncbi:MAG: hypothetical protein ACMXYM_04915 [Candidatus Woesearchaeota archaeon]
MKQIAVVFFVAMLVAGCSSDIDDRPAIIEEGGLVESDPPSGGDAPSRPDPSGGSAYDELRKLVMGAKEFTVTYEYSFAEQEMLMSQYVKGDNYRVDMVVAGGESRSYMLGDRFISCMKQGASWTCMELPSDDEEFDFEFGGDVIDDIEEDLFSGDVRRLPDRRIAGVNAKCFSVTTRILEVQDYTYCYSADGIPLLVEYTTKDASFRMVATEFSKTVPRNAFELPAEPVRVDDMLGDLFDFGDFMD